MITITCDKCEHTFEVGEEEAGDRVACPHCGDVNRIPGAAADSNAGSAAAIEAAPVSAGAGGRASEPERVLRVVRQAMFRAHPFWYLLLVLTFGAGLAIAVTAPPSGSINAWLFWVGLAIAAGAVVWWLIWWAAPHRWVKLTITNKRTIRQEGIVMKSTSEVLHNHIRGIKIEQSVLDRVLGVGAISIDTAGGSDADPIEIRMSHIARPYAVKDLIDHHRRL